MTSHLTESNKKSYLFAGSFSSYVFYTWLIGSAVLLLLYIALPLGKIITAPQLDNFIATIKDPAVLASVWLSFKTAGIAALIAFIFGTPLAYLLARHNFFGKNLVESLIDLPIMIPHPVVGIALLTISSPQTPFGKMLSSIGIEIMGTETGIVCVLFFVGIPFYINTVKGGIESIPVRLERVSRSLGASAGETFFRITMPLCWRYMLVGMIMCMARALSEFGAVIIVAYHPMIAPVLMYERFTSYGLTWSQPVAVILILVSLLCFLLLRVISLPNKKNL